MALYMMQIKYTREAIKDIAETAATVKTLLGR